MKKYTFYFVFLLLLLSTISYAQDRGTDLESKEAISKLAFLEGVWEGSGWMMGRNGQKNTFNQTENIQFKLDNTVLLIEGQGKANGKTVHDALAIITYNETEKDYNFRSYLANGRNGLFKAELIDNKLYWYPMENMRYIISINENGQWYETGELKRKDKWFQFFEMTLDKK